MALDKVKAFFRAYGMEGNIIEFDVSTATVELAAQALNIEPCRIAKTLSFDVEGQPILVVAAGDAKVDNSAFKNTFRTKARMLTPELTEQLIGHAVGGVCPFAINEGVKVYLDESLKRFETVYPACGSGNTAIELTLPQLEQFSNHKGWVNVCKNWQ